MASNLILKEAVNLGDCSVESNDFESMVRLMYKQSVSVLVELRRVFAYGVQDQVLSVDDCELLVSR